ncbi:hypothetical protein HBB16_19650 [Pseudonocardia sp. MCCB 268]|nr:hypothetical protein [Pseudonocardia cytotoxica]
MLTFMACSSRTALPELLGNVRPPAPAVPVDRSSPLHGRRALRRRGPSIGTWSCAPLAGPLFRHRRREHARVVAALAFCSTIVVDISPFSSNGVLVCHSAEYRRPPAFQRQPSATASRWCWWLPLGFVLAVALTS